MDPLGIHTRRFPCIWRQFFAFFECSNADEVINYLIHKMFIYCRIYEMELEANIDDRFKFPYFELCNFYAAKNMAETLKGQRSLNILKLIFYNFFTSE